MKKKIRKLEKHPLTSLFQTEDSSADSVKRAILKAGRLSPKTPVIVFEGKVIDRWEEYSVCKEFSLPCKFKEYEGSRESLLEFLLKKNKVLSLDKNRRALIGAWLKKIYREKSRENQSAGGAGKQLIAQYHARDAASEMIKVSSRLIGDAEAVLDAGSEKLVDYVTDGLLSLSKAAMLARRPKEVLNAFLAGAEDKIAEALNILPAWREMEDNPNREDYEKELRNIRQVYKEKRQTLNADMHRRIALADTPEETERLKAELANSRKDLSSFQSVNTEKLRLRYEKKRATLLRKESNQIFAFKKKALRESLEGKLDKQKTFLVYIRWNYEMGQLKLEAVWESVHFFDQKNLCVTLKSGRKVLLEKEVLTVVATAEMAQAYCDAVNRKQFCHNKRVFRPNSWVSRIFDRIGENFKSSALELMKTMKTG